MYIRCADCLTSTWTSVVRAGKIVPSIECGGCGREYTLAPNPDLGTTMRSHYSRVLAFSKSHRLDAASAYAVLLGIMSIDQAQLLGCTGEPVLPQDPGVDAAAEPTADPVPTPVAGIASPEKAVAEPEPSHETSIGGGARELPAPTKTVRPPEPRVALADPHAEDERSKKLPEKTARRIGPLVAREIDPGFQTAIKAGRMTESQAITRGDRNAFAARLMKRHGMPRGLALKVADNHMSLGQALRRLKEAKTRKPAKAAQPRRRGVSRAQASLVMFLGLLSAAACVWYFWSNRLVVARSPASSRTVAAERPATDAPASAGGESATVPNDAATPPSLTRVRRNESGEIVEVWGPDPAGVLVSFCEASSEGPGREPIEVARTVPHSSEARLGVFRDFASMESAWVIHIRRDRRTGRWVAGNGRHPIHPTVAPKLPTDAAAIPVRR